MEAILPSLGRALFEAFAMFWEVLWPLVLGFALSAAVQAVVSRRALAHLLGDDSPRSLGLATLFGVASSSCSYAAVALARSIFRKGASFAAAMVFELASTNLVIELGIILIVRASCASHVGTATGRLGCRPMAHPKINPPINLWDITPPGVEG